MYRIQAYHLNSPYISTILVLEKPNLQTVPWYMYLAVRNFETPQTHFLSGPVTAVPRHLVQPRQRPEIMNKNSDYLLFANTGSDHHLFISAPILGFFLFGIPEPDSRLFSSLLESRSDASFDPGTSFVDFLSIEIVLQKLKCIKCPSFATDVFWKMGSQG